MSGQVHQGQSVARNKHPLPDFCSRAGCAGMYSADMTLWRCGHPVKRRMFTAESVH